MPCLRMLGRNMVRGKLACVMDGRDPMGKKNSQWSNPMFLYLQFYSFTINTKHIFHMVRVTIVRSNSLQDVRSMAMSAMAVVYEQFIYFVEEWWLLLEMGALGCNFLELRQSVLKIVITVICNSTNSSSVYYTHATMVRNNHSKSVKRNIFIKFTCN